MEIKLCRLTIKLEGKATQQFGSFTKKQGKQIQPSISQTQHLDFYSSSLKPGCLPNQMGKQSPTKKEQTKNVSSRQSIKMKELKLDPISLQKQNRPRVYSHPPNTNTAQIFDNELIKEKINRKSFFGTSEREQLRNRTESSPLSLDFRRQTKYSTINNLRQLNPNRISFYLNYPYLGKKELHKHFEKKIKLIIYKKKLNRPEIKTYFI